MRTAVAEAAYVDMLDPGNWYTPAIRRAQRETWYVRGPFADYVVLRHAEVSALLRDRRLRQATYMFLALNGIKDGLIAEWWDRLLLNLTGEEHTRLRRLVSKAFTPPAVDALRPFMRATAEGFADRLAQERRCDFVATFSDPYSLEVICELLQIPADRRAGFRGWAIDIGLAFSVHVVAQRERIETALRGLLGVVDDLIAERKAAPGSDLISALLAVEESGDRLTHDDVRMMVLSLVFAGNDTTRLQLGLSMYAFAEHPDQWSLLRERPELAENAVEEITRVYPAVPVIYRAAVEAFDFQDIHIAVGASLRLMLSAANRDPAVFGEDDDFDIRAGVRGRTLTFGGGINHCLGAWLARAEFEEAIPVLAARLRDPVLTGEPKWRRDGITGPLVLPVEFTPA